MEIVVVADGCIGKKVENNHNREHNDNFVCHIQPLLVTIYPHLPLMHGDVCVLVVSQVFVSYNHLHADHYLAEAYNDIDKSWHCYQHVQVDCHIPLHEGIGK